MTGGVERAGNGGLRLIPGAELVTDSQEGRTLMRSLAWTGAVNGLATEAQRASGLPAGTVTFLLTDIENSTALWEREPELMSVALARHDELIADAVDRHGGSRPLQQGEGDSVVAVFARPSDALAAALGAQLALNGERWPGGIELRVRMALHTAEAQPGPDGTYFGVALSRTARLRAMANGGQTVVSRSTYDLLTDRVPDDVELVDMGIHRLRGLERPEQVFGLVHPQLPLAFEPVRSIDVVPHNLPVQLTSFIGREQELAQADEALAATRMLTLTGAGGCGKTRLALRLAANALGRYSDGVFWVEFAPLQDAALAAPALARAVGVRPLPGQTDLEAVVSYLEAGQALVLFDNCEHLLEECARLAEVLLRGCPQLSVLATSREPLRVEGETDWRVPSLSLPEQRDDEPTRLLARSDALRLFVERAVKVRPNFTLTSENAAAAVCVCRELDGIPLAIEFAAARVSVLSVEQIANGVADSLRLLSGGRRSALPRYQTLRASIDWSHELLGEEERVLFRRLGVFSGGFTLKAAEQVCAHEGLPAGDVLHLLASLVEKSLVQAEENGPSVRYRLLETVRHYALERLTQAAELRPIRDRHRDTFLRLAEQLEPELLTPRQRTCLDVLDTEAANLTAAIEWAAESEPEKALQLCVALTYWWRMRGLLANGEAAFGTALGATDMEPSVLRARAQWGRSYLLVFAGEFEAAISPAHDAFAVAEKLGDESTMGRALYTVGMCRWMPDPIGCRAGLQRARELAKASDDELGLAHITHALAFSYSVQEDHEQATRLLYEVLPIIERIDHRELLAWHGMGLGWNHYTRGEHAIARQVLEGAIEATRTIGEPDSETAATTWLALTMIDAGEPELALERAEPVLERALTLGAGMTLPWLLLAMAQAQAASGRLEEARDAFEALIEGPASDVAHVLAWAHAGLGETLRLLGDSIGAATIASRALELAEALGNPWFAARARGVLGRLAAARPEWAQAERLHHEALSGILQHSLRVELPGALEALADVAAGLDSHVEAARILGAAERSRTEFGFIAWKHQRAEVDKLACLVREALGDEAFERAHSEGLALTTDEAVAWLRRARGSRKRPPSGWESLTPTELEVARHAAAGLTNQEIGERMFISSGTVKVHLSHIYAKLGLRNRAELTHHAASQIPMQSSS